MPARARLRDANIDGVATADPDLRIQAANTLFNALSDTIRLGLLAILKTQSEVCVCHFQAELALPQPTISRHLAILRRAGLVSTRRDGLWVHYRLKAQESPVLEAAFQAALATLPDRPLSALGMCGEESHETLRIIGKCCD